MGSEAWRPAAAARNRSPREARDPALQALRPGCEELAVADPAQMPVREARPREPKTATVERERRASRVITAFTRVFDAHDTPHGCSAEHPNVSRRSAHPRFGLAKQSCKPRAQTCGAGTNGLFDK